ncbi:MAG: hypothetical protein OWQ54_02640 [Sulfolobaceae archaeon]|nr:hypothetical protein [Sulfolobaceae archaeon]
MNLVEGYMLKYRGGIWAVKGCYHPEGFAVAIIRYFNGMKIKRLSDSIALIKQKFPELLKYVKQIGFEVPLVPLKDSEILDPFELSNLPKHVTEFLDALNSKGDVGITGSLLYNPSEAKDMDFLTFNNSYYEKLLRLRKNGVTKALDVVNDEEIETLDYEDFKSLKANRVLEGTFKGIPYTFKIVECTDFGEVLEERYYEGVLEIRRSLKPFSLPVIYDVGSGFATSFRIRFTELKEGAKIFFEGTVYVRKGIIDYDLDTARRVKILT